eukprot:Skav226059  [mRNA]  locus=scaffold211:333638:337489:- [translate_table: standard]
MAEPCGSRQAEPDACNSTVQPFGHPAGPAVSSSAKLAATCNSKTLAMQQLEGDVSHSNLKPEHTPEAPLCKKPVPPCKPKKLPQLDERPGPRKPRPHCCRWAKAKRVPHGRFYPPPGRLPAIREDTTEFWVPCDYDSDGTNYDTDDDDYDSDGDYDMGDETLRELKDKLAREFPDSLLELIGFVRWMGWSFAERGRRAQVEEVLAWHWEVLAWHYRAVAALKGEIA